MKGKGHVWANFKNRLVKMQGVEKSYEKRIHRQNKFNREDKVKARSLVLGVVISGNDPLAALETVHFLGLLTCQLYVPSLEWQTSEGATAIKNKLSMTKIHLTSLICAFQGEDYSSLEAIRHTVGLVNPNTSEERVDWILTASEFAQKIEVKVIQGHLGFVPERNIPEYDRLVADVRKIADHLKWKGQFFALETGQESGRDLLQLIQDIDRDNIKVNFDPANFLIYNSDEPLAALEMLKDYVVGVHCKDARRPREKCVLGSEAPLGEGEVDIPVFIKKLKEYGYTGPLTIEREISSEEQWKKDVLKAKQFLESLI